MHIAVDALAVALFLALDMVQGLAHGRVGELEDAGVVEAGHVLFHGQGVGAEEGILLPFRAVLGWALAGGLLQGPGLLLPLLTLLLALLLRLLLLVVAVSIASPLWLLLVVAVVALLLVVEKIVWHFCTI